MLLKYVKKTNDGVKHIYLNCHLKGSKTYGQLLNHSSLHPNAVTKIYATGKNRLDVIFVAKCDIRVDEEIVWDYGKNYTGVNPCVTVRHNLAMHCSVTPFIIWQPIRRPCLLERVYKPMRTSH